MELSLSLPEGVREPEQTIPGVSLAAADLAESLQAGEKVAVFCDYDPDGTCGAAVISLALEPFEDQTMFGFASASSGTGLTEEFVRRVASEGASMLVTVDLGSSQPGAVSLARELGLRVVVTDHHSAHPDVDPDHHLNPTLHGPSESSGAVVAWKLALSLEEELYGAPSERTLTRGAFLAAFGARADMMDMKEEENSALHDFSSDAPPGLRVLADRLGVRSFSATNQAKLAALLNLPKRSARARAEDAARILTADSGPVASEAIERLLRVREDCNEASRRFGSQAASQMSLQAPARVASAVIDEDDAHLYAGYAGIVAMRMSGAAGRPAVIFVPLDEDKSSYKYSVRWTGKREGLGEGLLEAMGPLGEVAARSGGNPPGGHPQAMGGVCASGDIEAVTETLEAWAASRGLQKMVLESSTES